MEEKRYSRLILEQMAVGEIELPGDPEEHAIVARKIEELQVSNSEILARYPASVVAGQISERLAKDEVDRDHVDTSDDVESMLQFPGRSRRPVQRYVLAAAALVFVLSGAILTLTGRLDNNLPGPIRIKGEDDEISTAIKIYRKVENDAELLNDRAAVGENDLVQIAYVSGGKPYGAVISLDGRGVVTVHYPYESGLAGSLVFGGEHALDYSYRLDDAPDFERFFFLTSDTQFNMVVAVSAARTLAGTPNGGRSGRLSLPEEIEQNSISLTKEISNE